MMWLEVIHIRVAEKELDRLMPRSVKKRTAEK